MRKQNKKGFTIVELVIVIAVIAILVAVMVPTFVTLVRKAQVSNDRQLVKNLNTALAAESVTEKPATMTRALEIAADYGYDVAKINAKASGNLILWDSTNNVYCYFNDDGVVEYIPEAPQATKVQSNVEYWVISDKVSDTYSTYYTGTETELIGDKAVKTGFDAGTSGVTKIEYTTDAAQTVTIRTNSDQCTLTINAGNSDVNFYGFAKEVNVTEVKPASLHIFGGVAELKIEKGHVAVETTGIVFDVVQMGAADVAEVASVAATITNNGYIGVISLSENTVAAVKEAILADETKVVATKAIGGDYEIATLAQLEVFRDTVNAGNDFDKKTVKLTADIKLNDGWKPIGEGARKVGKTNTGATNIQSFFKGTFDGNGKTISNLNNKGFVPTEARLVKDGDDSTYAYGLFALVGSGATIKNLKLTNVAIDTTTYAAAIGDSVGALVGYANGKITVTGVEVSGSVKASDSVAGIVGRIYNEAGSEIDGCTNNANVTAGTTTSGQKGAGIVGYTNVGLTIKNCTNTGTIAGGYKVTNTNPEDFRASIAVVSTAAKTASTFENNKNGTTAVGDPVKVGKNDWLIGNVD